MTEDEVESITGETCPICGKKTLTLMEAEREIPFFGKVAIFSMGCSDCNYHKADVEALEKNVKYISDRIDRIQTEMDQNARAQQQVLEQEQQTRAKEDEELRAKLEATETGGLRISAMGALWLFVGVTMSTAAPELAKWLN